MPPRNRVTVTCLQCGKALERRPSVIHKMNFCSRTCQHKYYRNFYRGENNPDWKGGKHITPQGYVRVRMPDHSRAVGGYVLEHILVMEKVLGRSLKPKERVHHINHNPADNRPENLMVFNSNGEHLREAGHHKTTHYCKCGRKVKGHGLCFRHLAQFKRTGKSWDFENEYLKTSPGDGKRYTRQSDLKCPCGQPAHCKGLCGKHYRYWCNHGVLPEPDAL